MILSLKKHTLNLKHTFRISREARDFQNSLILALSLDGKTGYGEATSNLHYGISIEIMIAEIKAIQNQLEAFNFTTPEILHAFLVSKTPASMSVLFVLILNWTSDDVFDELFSCESPWLL